VTDAWRQAPLASQQPAWKQAPLANAPQGSALARVGNAAVEGFGEGWGGPVQGASPFVRETFIDPAAPGIKQLNQFLLETVPAAVQDVGKGVSGAVGGLASGVGQTLEELGVSGAREQAEGLTRQVMSLPVAPEMSAFGVSGSIPRRMAARTAEEIIPTTTEDLRRQAGAAYKAADRAGVTVSSDKMAQVANDVAKIAEDEGVDPVLHPRATRAVTIVQEDAAAGPRTLSQLEKTRRKIRMAGRSLDPDERRIAEIMLERLDDQIAKLSPADVTGGDVRAGVTALTEGRDLWNRMRKSERVEDILENAQSATNPDKAIRRGIDNLLRNKKLRRLYDAEELALLRDATRESLYSFLARLSPKSGTLPLLANAAAVVHDPTMIVASVGATVAKALGNSATARRVGHALDRIRAGQSIDSVRQSMTAEEWKMLIESGALRGAEASTARGINQPHDEYLRALQGLSGTGPR
jgi:hypothetical protein